MQHFFLLMELGRSLLRFDRKVQFIVRYRIMDSASQTFKATATPKPRAGMARAAPSKALSKGSHRHCSHSRETHPSVPTERGKMPLRSLRHGLTHGSTCTHSKASCPTYIKGLRRLAAGGFKVTQTGSKRIKCWNLRTLPSTGFRAELMQLARHP